MSIYKTGKNHFNRFCTFKDIKTQTKKPQKCLVIFGPPCTLDHLLIPYSHRWLGHKTLKFNIQHTTHIRHIKPTHKKPEAVHSSVFNLFNEVVLLCTTV